MAALACALLLMPTADPRAADATAAGGLAADFSAARLHFEEGRAGSRTATDLAQELFSRLLHADGDNPLYLAYYGSTYALQGRDSTAPWTRLRLINKGVAMLDRALALLDQAVARSNAAAGSAQLETRLVAIATYVALPDILFHRLDAAQRQYQLAVGSPDYALAPTELQGHLQYEGALIARARHQDAAEKTALQRVLALWPEHVDLDEVRTRLAALP